MTWICFKYLHRDLLLSEKNCVDQIKENKSGKAYVLHCIHIQGENFSSFGLVVIFIAFKVRSGRKFHKSWFIWRNGFIFISPQKFGAWLAVLHLKIFMSCSRSMDFNLICKKPANSEIPTINSPAYFSLYSP